MFTVIKRLGLTIKKRWKLSLFALLILGGAGYYYYQQAQAAAIPKYRTEQPTRQDLTQTLAVSGIVDAKEKARMRFMAGGKLTYLGAQEGAAVKKGQTIANIDQATLQRELEQQLNLYTQERLDWENTRDGIKDRAIDTTENRSVEQEQLDLRNTVLSVETKDIAIRNTRLVAPFAGILTVSPSTVTGVQIQATDYFELINPESLIFRGAVDEADIALVQLNQTASLSLDAFQDRSIETSVSYIALTSSQGNSGTVFAVEFPLSSTSLQEGVRLGMNGDIEIKLATVRNALTIPVIATREREDKVYVDIVEPSGSLREQEITVGLETEDYVEILSGLQESDSIAVPE